MLVTREPGSRSTSRSGRLSCLKSTQMNDRSAGSTIKRDQLVLGGLARDDDHVSSLTLSTELADSIIEYLRGCLPDEGVGVVATSGIGSCLAPGRLYPGPNMDRSTRGYTKDTV